MSYQRYNPEKDLPEEIVSLPKEETKCKFCGVSYLVHHEVKKLENQLLKIQSELDEFHTQRHQLKEIPSLHVQIRELNMKLSENEVKLKKEKESNHKNIVAHESMKSHVLSSLRYTLQSLHSYKKEKNDLKHYVEVLATFNRDSISEVMSRVSRAHKKWKRIESEKEFNRSKLEQLLNSERLKTMKVTERLTNEVKDEKDKVMGKAKELHILKERIKNMEESISKMKLQNEELQREKLTLQQKLKAESDGWTKKVQLASSNHTEQMATLKQEIVEKNNEVIKLKLKLKEQNETNEHRLSTCKQKIEELLNKLKHKDTELQKFQEVSAEKVELIRKQMNHRIRELEQEKTVIHEENLRNNDKLNKEHKKQIEEMKVIFSQSESTLQNKIQSLQEQLSQEKMKVIRSQSESTLQNKIRSLQEQLSQEKKIFEVDSMRHINEVKDFTYKLQQSEKVIEETRNHCNTRIQSIVKDKEHIKKECDELSQQKNELDKKLQEAYNEISCLQKIVEQQCAERTELMVKLNSK